MNFLQLCQRVRQECGITGNGPTSVIGQQGQMAKVVDWVRTAWLEVQNVRTDWDFMWGNLTFDTASLEDAYTTNTTNIDTIDDLMIYEKSKGRSDGKSLEQVSYQELRDYYLQGGEETGRPVKYAIRPDKAIVFAPTPIEIYTVSVDYYKTPVSLAANTDEIDIAESKHEVVMYKAMMYFAAHFEAPMLYQHSQAQYDRLINELEFKQMPEMEVTTVPLA